ncbi:MAG: 2-dehydro-3-deoxygalactonokinase, partial [Verrucomicrobiales bacterium]|nr:2-dehydro-3-deoxygalactonokinase [Verrucomicrobiales bacterium]
MTPSPEFLSCDWGTTSFRLRRVRGPDSEVTGELRNEEGVKVVHARLADVGRAADARARAEAFAAVLERAIRDLGEGPEGPVADGTPVLVSGMASSTLGWKELPYARVPCGLDGDGLRIEAVEPVRVDGRTYPVSMVSGLATDGDVLRGEETELLGTLALPELAAMRNACVVVLPGTHSKHVRVRDGAVVDFRTFMTGELLEILSTHSVLRASVTWPPPAGVPGAEAAVRDGARAARDLGLARGLFRVRVRTVLERCERGDNTWFLVGLATGAEIMDLLAWDSALPVVLAGSAAVSAGYRAVIDALGAAA